MCSNLISPSFFLAFNMILSVFLCPDFEMPHGYFCFFLVLLVCLVHHVLKFDFLFILCCIQHDLECLFVPRFWNASWLFLLCFFGFYACYFMVYTIVIKLLDDMVYFIFLEVHVVNSSALELVLKLTRWSLMCTSLFFFLS